MASNKTILAPIFVPVAKRSNEDLVKENIKLREEVASLQKENANLKTQLGKRKTSPSLGDTTQPASSSKKAKTPTQRKKLFEKWVKAVTRESSKTKLTTYDGNMSYDVIVKETTPWTVADFESVFLSSAKEDTTGMTKIQPTPDNKPTSQITILKWNDYGSIQKLFGDATIPQTGYKAQAWKKRNFMKSWRAGDYADNTLESMEVHYNKSKFTLQLKFTLRTDECYE